MRAVLSQESLTSLFGRVKDKLGLRWPEIAKICGVSCRTLRDWRRAKYTIPTETLERLSSQYGIEKTEIIKYLENFWYTSKGGKVSGPQNFKKYGNIGTPESRKLGALRALETHRKKRTGFFVPKNICLPSPSRKLAELIGILLGDGGITKKQVTITLHRYDDAEYIDYVVSLCNDLLRVQPSRIYRDNVCNIVISRTKLISYLVTMGLCIGNKVRQQIKVPSWISANLSLSKHCLRGLFDTDGCFYVDKHKYGKKVYLNGGMNFTNRSIPLLDFFKGTLQKLGFSPTQKTPFSIFLRKEEEIINYFKTIGSSNPKHKNKFINYLKNRYGRVPKWS